VWGVILLGGLLGVETIPVGGDVGGYPVFR